MPLPGAPGPSGARRLSGGVPACSCVPGALSILHGCPGRSAWLLGSSSCHFKLAQRPCAPRVTGALGLPLPTVLTLGLFSWCFGSFYFGAPPLTLGPSLPPCSPRHPLLPLWVSSCTPCTRGPPSDSAVVPPPLSPRPRLSYSAFAGDLRLLVQRRRGGGAAVPLQDRASLSLSPRGSHVPRQYSIFSPGTPWYSLSLRRLRRQQEGSFARLLPALPGGGP